jgi:type II secretory ATPase GspE/PulE/Tfp pilus assembly ATPase PilB-like protein
VRRRPPPGRRRPSAAGPQPNRISNDTSQTHSRVDQASALLSDPTDPQAIDRVQFQAQATVDPIVVEHDPLLKALERLGRSASQRLSDRVGDSFDGEIAQPPLAIKEKHASRIKVISKLDISEKRVPQDGRMKLVLSPQRAIDFRVSTLPTLVGEKIVMRILDPSSARLGIDALGYDPDQKDTLLAAIRRPYGIVLVSGPPGSGKTVSLYTCLNILNQPGVNQVNVNDKAGLSFAAALKSFLRQDPDVIMVGEIRDLETADISIKAAQTGHTVLSTLHTKDAPTTLTRMMDMGIAPFNIASSVILIIPQRLARQLCACKAQAPASRPASWTSCSTDSRPTRRRCRRSRARSSRRCSIRGR